MEKIVVVDGHNLLFRMYYGIPASILNREGREIKGLVGFLGSLKKLAEQFDPCALAVVFDSETSWAGNLAIDSHYKANRRDYADVPEGENPFAQLPLIKKALDYLDIPHREAEGVEADDFIAYLVAREGAAGRACTVVSTDSDFIQLVDGRTTLYVPRGKNSVLFDCRRVRERFQIAPGEYVLYKALVGDKSDNIEGVRGIGPKTAAAILHSGGIAPYIAAQPASKTAGILRENRDKIARNERLIALDRTLDTGALVPRRPSPALRERKTYEVIAAIGER